MQAPEIFKILSDDLRWAIIQQLRLSDMKVSELAQALQEADNKISYHLGKLREANLVRERRSSADSRDVYYSLQLNELSAQFKEAGLLLHPLIFEAEAIAQADKPPMIRLQKPVRILFLCTHNSARSQMAEGLARHMGGGLIEAYSAGTEATFIKPEAIEVMKRRGIDITQQKSEVLTQYLDQEFDYVITVCDSARESCPIFAGGKHHLHWSFEDPSDAPPDQRLMAFEQTARQLATRIGYLITIIAKQQGVPVPIEAARQAAT